MSRSIPEKDWKKFRAIKDELLDTACDRILEKIKDLIGNRNGENHKVYLKLWKVLKQEDHKIADMFDDPKRSNALYKTAALVRYDLIGEDMLKEFSEETQEKIKIINQM